MNSERRRAMAVYTLLTLIVGEQEIRRHCARLYTVARIKEICRQHDIEDGKFLYHNLYGNWCFQDGDSHTIMTALWSYCQLAEDDDYLKEVRANTTDSRIIKDITILLKQLAPKWKTVRINLETAIRTISNAEKKTEAVYCTLRNEHTEIPEYWISSIWEQPNE